MSTKEIKKIEDDFIEYDYVGRDERRKINIYSTLEKLKNKINEIIDLCKEQK